MSKAESLPRIFVTVCDSGSAPVCFTLLRVLGRFFNEFVQILLPMLVIFFFPSGLLQQEIAQCDCCVKQYLLLFLWKLLLASFNSPQYWQADKPPFPTYQANPCRNILEVHASFHFLMSSNQYSTFSELFQSAAAKQELVGLCPGDPNACTTLSLSLLLQSKANFLPVCKFDGGRIELGAQLS